MNGDRSPNCDNHIRILNTIRNEQLYVNELVSQYNSITDNMKRNAIYRT